MRAEVIAGQVRTADVNAEGDALYYGVLTDPRTASLTRVY